MVVAVDRIRARRDRGNHIRNGIAYDDKTGLFYLTGKRWTAILRRRFTELRR